MNFLGHLYFSNDDPQLMYANLLGDYIKGRDYTYLPTSIQRGIHLHREIDNYIDHHPVVVELLHKLYEPLPKIAGIAVDLYFDHLLAMNWNEFHPTPLRTFTNEFYATDINHIEHYPADFMFMLSKMKEFDWLYAYKSFNGLTSACEGLSRRISFENTLHKAPTVFTDHQDIITDTFFNYMKEARPHFKEYFGNHSI